MMNSGTQEHIFKATTLPLAAALLLGGCANFTAVPTANHPEARGLRVYSPKTLVIVNGSGVSSIVVPDCSKEYALQFNSFLAVNDVTVELENGMVTKILNKQDTTAVPLKLIEAVVEAAKAGKSLGTAFSTKADGGATDRLGVFELSCVEGQLVAAQAINEASLMKLKTSPASGAVPPPIPDDNGDEDSIPIPKK
jgi:hypothetical protein